MARCTAHAERTGEITVDAEPASADAGADSSPGELRPTVSRTERVGDGRTRRSFEGRVMSEIRRQSRRRDARRKPQRPGTASQQR